MSCKCGGIIYADTEDWENPLCYYCYEKIDQSFRLTIIEQENKILKEALEFYGLHENWCQTINGVYNYKIWVPIESDYHGSISTENGKHARQALEKVKGLGGLE